MKIIPFVECYRNSKCHCKSELLLEVTTVNHMLLLRKEKEPFEFSADVKLIDRSLAILWKTFGIA